MKAVPSFKFAITVGIRFQVPRLLTTVEPETLTRVSGDRLGLKGPANRPDDCRQRTAARQPIWLPVRTAQMLSYHKAGHPG